MLEKGNIVVREHADDWADALRKAGALLVNAGSVSIAYIENMVASIRRFGPYIVVIPHVALAHAAPDETVYKEDFALLTLDEPVTFGSRNDPVSVIYALCATNNNEHLSLLQTMGALLTDDVTERLMACQTVEQAYSTVLLAQHANEEGAPLASRVD